VAGDKWQVTGTGSKAAHLVTRHPSRVTRHAFTLVEVLVVVVLMSFIILALMAVFNSTQSAFRASITQTDVLEGGRAAMGLMKSDLESMAPSFGVSNSAVNFYANTNFYQYQSGSTPLVQSLAGSGYLRTNVLENFFILTRQNTTWTGVGYVVDTTSTNYFNPLYRFTATANVSAQNMPLGLYTNFFANTGLPVSSANTNLSHLMDGVVHLTVRAYDPNGYWMTNLPTYYYDPVFGQMTNDLSKNVWFSGPAWGEVGFYMYSNTLPASVEIQLGMLEDRTLQRAQSISGLTQSNYLAQHAGQVHLFRQRIPIRNVDPSAYQ
jgi:prepilin-type N-terminal cleavage/methylation domain-containing protein